MRHRNRLLIVTAVLLAAVTATTIVVLSTRDSAQSPGGAGRVTTPAPTGPPAIALSTGPFAAGPVAPPASGAFLGAWVRPERLTQHGRESAVLAFQRRLGRQLDIVHTYRRLDEVFFNESDLGAARRGSTLMLSWAGGDTRSVTLGQHDALIRQRARDVKAFGRPLLLRYRWEMDRPGLRAQMWSGEDYVAAWRHVRRLFAEEGAANASWVWCPTAEGFHGPDVRAAPFYPGDSHVDWICADVYAGSKFQPMARLIEPFLRFAAGHPTKPVMIGEFGVARVWGTEQRAAWLRESAAVFRANPQIRAVMYFESDPIDNDGPTQQFQVSDDPTVLEALRDLARQPHFNPTGR